MTTVLKPKMRRLGIHGLGTTQMDGVFLKSGTFIDLEMRSTLWEAVKDNYPSEIWGDLVCWGMDMVNKHMVNPICNGMQESPFFFWWCFLSIPPNGSKWFFIERGIIYGNGDVTYPKIIVWTKSGSVIGWWFFMFLLVIWWMRIVITTDCYFDSRIGWNCPDPDVLVCYLELHWSDARRFTLWFWKWVYTVNRLQVGVMHDIHPYHSISISQLEFYMFYELSCNDL